MTLAIAFVLIVAGLATGDVLGLPLAEAAHSVVTRVNIPGPATGPGATENGHVPGSDGLIEGGDWSLISPADGLLRWPCDHEIPVILSGPAPSGSEAALNSVVTELAKLSGLNLTLGTPELSWSDDDWREGGILVRYVDPTKRQAPGITFR